MKYPKVDKSITLLLAAIVLVLVVIMGYVSYQKQVLVFKPVDKKVQELETQSESTEIGAIEKDILDTDLSNLDKELEDIEKELDQVY